MNRTWIHIIAVGAVAALMIILLLIDINKDSSKTPYPTTSSYHDNEFERNNP